MLIPNRLQTKFKNEEMGYSDPCQFFVHNSDNSWSNVTVTNAASKAESVKQCPKSKITFEPHLVAQDPHKFKWEQLRDGLFYVFEASTRNMPNPNGIVWKADKILVDTSEIGVKLKKGDMIMQILRPVSQNQSEAVYTLVLRPLK